MARRGHKPSKKRNSNTSTSEVITGAVAKPEPEYFNIEATNSLSTVKGIILKGLKEKIEPPIKELTFSEDAWIKINCYIHLVGGLEVTGFGKVEDGVITDIAILPQVISGAGAETLDTTDVADFYSEIPEDERNLWVLDWHSHVNMKSSPSVTDDNNYNVMHTLRGGETYPVMIINKRQEVWCSNYIADRLYIDIKVYLPQNENTDVSSLIDLNKRISDIYYQCLEDVEKNCIEVSYPKTKAAPAYNYPKALQEENKTYGGYYDDYYSSYYDNYGNNKGTVISSSLYNAYGNAYGVKREVVK